VLTDVNGFGATVNLDEERAAVLPFQPFSPDRWSTSWGVILPKLIVTEYVAQDGGS
jgi:hypothetical protein